MSTDESPWAQPGEWQPPPAGRPATPSGESGQPKGAHSAGAVTRLAERVPVFEQPDEPPADPEAGERRRLMWFGLIAAGVVAAGLAIVLSYVLTGPGQPFWDRPSGPNNEALPPLARMCPPPVVPPSNGLGNPPAVEPAGPRTVDEKSGISYKRYGAPWQPWLTVWRGGELEVAYAVGQHFVTENYPGGTYHASILSGSVPATQNDALTLDLECVGRQVASDVRSEYYPAPNTQEVLRDELTTLGGRPAWVTEFRLHFDRDGLQAKDERAAVATIDVGRPEAAILYVSIPGTHKQFDYVIDEVLQSVRPT